MKVVVLAAALEAGIEAEHVLSVPKCLQLRRHRACTETPGETTVAEAIVISNNPAFVMLTDLVGLQHCGRVREPCRHGSGAGLGHPSRT